METVRNEQAWFDNMHWGELTQDVCVHPFCTSKHTLNYIFLDSQNNSGIYCTGIFFDFSFICYSLIVYLVRYQVIWHAIFDDKNTK